MSIMTRKSSLLRFADRYLATPKGRIRPVGYTGPVAMSC